MLQSQRQIAVRSTPDRDPPAIIRTKTEWEKITPAHEDALFQIMSRDAHKSNERMIGGGAWDNGCADNEAVGRPKGYQHAVLYYLKANPGWADKATLMANVDIPAKSLFNALHSLVRSGSLVKRTADGDTGKIGQWCLAEGADLSPKALRRTNRQRINLALTDDWQTTAQIAAKVGLTSRQTLKALGSLAGAGDAERQDREQHNGGKKAVWRKAGAVRRKMRRSAVDQLLSVFEGGEWLTLRQIADAIKTWSDKRIQSHLSTQVSREVIERRFNVIDGRKKSQWRRKEGGA